jgi:hypothetical protein
LNYGKPRKDQETNPCQAHRAHDKDPRARPVLFGTASREQDLAKDLEQNIHAASMVANLTARLRHGAPRGFDMEQERHRAVAWSRRVKWHTFSCG